MTIKWSEGFIAGALARQFFNRKYLAVVDNCGGLNGYECDMLVVTPNLLVIDVEIKISRADLKADAKKYKWWHRKFMGYGERKEVLSRDGTRVIGWKRPAIYDVTPLAWPPKVWKHYYAMPAEIWRPDLVECLPSNESGILLLSPRLGWTDQVKIQSVRHARANKDAEVLSPARAIDIARLASLRMWDAYDTIERLRNEKNT